MERRVLSHIMRLFHHWIIQYRQTPSRRWIPSDADTSLEKPSFDPYDLPAAAFDVAADAWLVVRAGQKDEKSSRYDGPDAEALHDLAAQVRCDCHCLMKKEMISPLYWLFGTSVQNRQVYFAVFCFYGVFSRTDVPSSQYTYAEQK